MISSLSVCLIVKNEEQYLEDCLLSVKDVADQIILLDTGSTDRTVEIATSLGAEIHQFEWCDDFAAARNESIRHADSDWIMWLDADERLPESEQSKLKQLLKPSPGTLAYRVRIRNLKEDGENYSLSDAHRLFTNHKGISFSGSIHEQVSPSLKAVGGKELDANFYLWHLGYGLGGEEHSKKLERNYNLLSTGLQTDPDNAYLRYTLAHNLKERGELGQAILEYERVLKTETFDRAMKASLLNTLADCYLESGTGEKADALLDGSIQLEAEQLAAYYLKYRLAERSGKSALMLNYLKKLLSRVENAKFESKISTDIHIPLETLRHSIGQLLERMGDLPAALELYASAPDLSRKEQQRFVEMALQQNQLELVEANVASWGEWHAQEPRELELAALFHLKRGRIDSALEAYIELQGRFPENVQITKRIAGIYAKLGQQDKAVQIIQQITT